ncbi:E3 ubiquitin-protein ligase TRIM39-like [Leptodactylus fuscus]|uniref:E3 ubiquitin-protein ligase TRIM39-like n=1 Tax=Leptodactylus fuscus TaxID=238119 RepID=UPI003F4E4F33
MASTDLRAELGCSICLDIYTDPVTLSCGHNFCRVCIEQELCRLEEVGVYSCPHCRENFFERPTLRSNTTLNNIAQSFLSIPEQETSGIFCTFCDFPVPAVRSCVQCETSLCYHHLVKHDQTVEHTLILPTTSPARRKCTVHHKVLEYYCCEDSVCICALCMSSGHREHRVESLDGALQIKKDKMRNVLQKLTTTMEETEKKAHSLQKMEQGLQGKANGLTERVQTIFSDIRTHLEDLEKRVLGEISSRKQKLSLSILDWIQELEVKKNELTSKISHIEDLCNVTDPITVLQDSTGDDFWDAKEAVSKGKFSEFKLHGVGELNEGLISEIVEESLSKIMTNVKTRLSSLGQTGLLMNINTAGNHVHLSDDLKTVTWSRVSQCYPETPERFQYPQILSTDGFHTGQHYWDVETSDTGGGWRLGMCYPSMDRIGDHSFIGDNEKSWCLRCQMKQYSVLHDNVETMLSLKPSCHRLRMCLDYEAGELSFYEVCDPIRPLYTFTATFTEPLHVGFRLHKSWVKIIDPE